MPITPTRDAHPQSRSDNRQAVPSGLHRAVSLEGIEPCVRELGGPLVRQSRRGVSPRGPTTRRLGDRECIKEREIEGWNNRGFMSYMLIERIPEAPTQP